MITVVALGGSGEDSRNCFLVEAQGHRILLDCGVRREIAPNERVYPLVTKDIAVSLEAVFLSHAHEDHSAGLPYLWELGYRGPIYASKPTIGLVKGFLRKWVSYVESNGAIPPFSPKNMDLLDFRPIEKGTTDFDGFRVLAGRSGHSLGSFWYRFSFNAKTLLYTGDLCMDSLLLEFDSLPTCDVLIVDSAYASRVLHQEKQYEKLVECIRNATEKGGAVLLPVPSNGRGVDIFLYLLSQNMELVVEDAIVQCAEALGHEKAWIRDSSLWRMQPLYEVVSDGNRSQVMKHLAGKVVLTPDGMLTSPIAQSYAKAMEKDCYGLVLITGHVAKGTRGFQLLDSAFRKEKGILTDCRALTVKVHPDRQDVETLAARTGCRDVMLFHAPAEDCGNLKVALGKKGLKVVCSVSACLSF